MVCLSLAFDSFNNDPTPRASVLSLFILAGVYCKEVGAPSQPKQSPPDYFFKTENTYGTNWKKQLCV